MQNEEKSLLGWKMLDKILEFEENKKFNEHETLVLTLMCDHPKQIIELIEKYPNLTETQFQKLLENKEE